MERIAFDESLNFFERLDFVEQHKVVIENSLIEDALVQRSLGFTVIPGFNGLSDCSCVGIPFHDHEVWGFANIKVHGLLLWLNGPAFRQEILVSATNAVLVPILR